MDTNILVYVIAAILLIVGLLALFRKEKKVAGVSKGLFSILVIGGVFLIAMQAGWLLSWGISPLTGVGEALPIAATVVTPTANQPSGSVACTVDTTTVTLSAVDKYTSVAAGGYHRYKLAGAAAAVVADAGTFTASPGQKLEVLWSNASTTGYFSKVATYTIPCSGTYTPTEGNSPIQLVNNGSLTTRIFNSNGVLIDGAATNQSLSAGDVKSLKMEIEGSYQKDIPYGVIAVVEFNKTSIDDVVLSNRATGVELVSANVPQVDATTLGTESSRKAYLIDSISSNAIQEFTVTLDADDSVTPGIGSDVLIRYLPRNYFINDKTGASFDGPAAEDEYNVRTRSAGLSSTLEVD